MWTVASALALTLSISITSALPLELHYAMDASEYGVDIARCRKLVYAARVCGRHRVYLLNSLRKDLVRFRIGNYSTMNILPTAVEYVSEPSDTTICEGYRWFWINWGNGKMGYGTGKTVGEDVLFEIADPTGQDVQDLITWGYKPGYIRFGETGKGRFERLIGSGKFSDGLIEEVSTGLTECADRCSSHQNCGMFSYNTEQGMCAIFDRMVSSFTLTSQADWTSWKMLYCYP